MMNRERGKDAQTEREGRERIKERYRDREKEVERKRDIGTSKEIE